MIYFSKRYKHLFLRPLLPAVVALSLSGGLLTACSRREPAAPIVTEHGAEKALTSVSFHANGTVNAAMDVPTGPGGATESGGTAGLSGSTTPNGTAAPGGATTSRTAESGAALVLDTGDTIVERIKVPDTFTRVSAKEGSFAQFVRSYPLLPAGSPVLLYNGEEKRNQTAHAAVFDMPLSDRDLQQCADSVFRLYAEYLRANGRSGQISFHFVNGFVFSYDKWKEGYRISLSSDGTKVSWVKKAEPGDTEESFSRYLDTLFAYASTLSMDSESRPRELSELEIGDVFLKAGSPGHVVLVADLCQDPSGKKAFLLAQGFMPAQQFHLLINPLHPEDPWYYETEFSWPFVTPEYRFQEGSLRALEYLRD